MALKLACQRATDEEIEQARKLHEQMLLAVQKKDINSFIELNSAFHNKLLFACGNRKLCTLLRTYRDQYYDRRLVHVFSAGDWRSMPKQHELLLERSQRKPKFGRKSRSQTYHNGSSHRHRAL
jgi:DNA-binding GntR family transcriptional regulator